MKSNSNEVEHSRLTSRDELKEKEKTTKTNTKIIKQTNTINKMVFVLVYQCVYLVYVVFLIYKNENLKLIQFDFVFTIWFSYEDDFVF